MNETAALDWHQATITNRAKIDALMKTIPMTPEQFKALSELVTHFGDLAYECGAAKQRVKHERAQKPVVAGPAFSSDPDAPYVFEHTNGRWYINMGRPGFNTRINNSIGYATEAEAHRVSTSYGKK